jgi:hypothetical protein
MANFLDLLQLGIPQGYMGYVEYPKMSGGGKEILWQHTWDIDIPVPPRAVYYPGLDVIKTRLKGMEFDVGKDLAGNVDVNMRGFHILQAAGFESNGTITLNFVDFEDQVIYAMAMSFMQVSGANRYKFHVRKEDVIIPEFHIYFLNSSRLPVRKVTLYTLVFKSYDADYSTPGEPSGGREEVSLTFDYEHHDITIMNVSPHFTF